jgi:DNA-binding beta-propeller fold protein YncE
VIAFTRPSGGAAHDAVVRRSGIAIVLLLAGCGGSSGTPSAPGTTKQIGVPGAEVNPPAAVAPLVVATHRIGTLPAAVQLPAVAPLPGRRTLAMGGLDAADASVDAIVEIAPGGGSRIVGRLPTALHDAGGGTVGRTAYFVGGGNAGAGSPAIVSVRSGRAAPAGRLPVGASDVSTATIGGSVFVVGGYTGSVPLRSIMRFTPHHGVRVAAEMPRPLRYAAVAAVGGRLLIAGGTSGTTAVRDILAFDPGTNRVRRIGRLPFALTHASAAALGDRLLVIGGRGDSATSQHRTILAVDPTTGHVRRAGLLPVGLSDTAATASGGHITVLGGRDARGGVHSEILDIVPRPAPTAHPAARVPPLVDRANVYAAARPDGLAPALRSVPARIYVPNSRANTVDVIDQHTGRRVGHFATGTEPQHVVPSWDLRTLYVTSDQGNSLTPIDPRTGKPGRRIPVRDPYNLYFTADGRRAIVVAEAYRRLDFREPHTFRLRKSLPVPGCDGVDHMDFTRGGRMALVSCEFAARLIVVDLRRERLVKTIALTPGSMPQDVKLAPDGRTFYVADMMHGGVWRVDAAHLRRGRFIHTGAGAHGLYPSRDARVLYVSNRGAGSVSRISFRTGHVIGTWHLPGGGSPDMGGVSVDGRLLWLTGRYDSELYAISTRTGRLVHRIGVGAGPHGAAVWPQPGRYSIGHTGIMR